MQKTERMKVISLEIATERQGVSYTSVWVWQGFKLRTLIYSDSYDFQCKAKIQVWKDLAWSTVHSIAHSEMKTRSGLHYARQPTTVKDFVADSSELARVAKEVLV